MPFSTVPEMARFMSSEAQQAQHSMSMVSTYQVKESQQIHILFGLKLKKKIL